MSQEEHLSIPQDHPDWHVWRTADRLEATGLPNSGSGNNRLPSKVKERIHQLTPKVVSILRQWGKQWAGTGQLAGLLNKSTLMHELEESIIALAFLTEWLDRRRLQNSSTNYKASAIRPITIVDVCCGKGVLSMLLSYLFQQQIQDSDLLREVETPRKIFDFDVSQIIMLDKATNIDWSHIDAANAHALEEKRPRILTWNGCNLHDTDELAHRLLEATNATERGGKRIESSELAVVGIHLCKYLSPACVGLVNLLGQDRCPFFCLAPCCLPRAVYYNKDASRHLVVNKESDGGQDINPYPKNRRKEVMMMKEKENGGIIEILQYETPAERDKRLDTIQRRKNARKRGASPGACILCQATDHGGVHNCKLLPTDKQERIEIFQRAAAFTPCWKCGKVGHFKADCPSNQPSRIPTLQPSPMIRLDVSSVLGEQSRLDGDKSGMIISPFERYCGLLSTTIQRDHVTLVEAGLQSDQHQHLCRKTCLINGDCKHDDRRSVFIVATCN